MKLKRMMMTAAASTVVLGGEEWSCVAVSAPKANLAFVLWLSHDDRTFKGSFKVYAEVKGKPKATTVNVAGFLLNGVGYGTATIKGRGSVAVTIE